MGYKNIVNQKLGVGGGGGMPAAPPLNPPLVSSFIPSSGKKLSCICMTHGNSLPGNVQLYHFMTLLGHLAKEVEEEEEKRQKCNNDIKQACFENDEEIISTPHNCYPPPKKVILLTFSSC